MRALLAAAIICVLPFPVLAHHWQVHHAREHHWRPHRARAHRWRLHHHPVRHPRLRRSHAPGPLRVLFDDLRAGEEGVYEQVTEAAIAAGVPVAIARGVVRVESNFNPRARSSAGAIGIMQLLPRTARAMGENPYVLDGNLRAGMRYLKLALARSRDLCAGISLYNRGIFARPRCTAYGRKVLAAAR